MNDLIAREIVNGMWFVLSALMAAAFGLYVVRSKIGTAWPDWYNQLGVQAAIALFVFTFGSMMRAGWIWLLLSCQNENRSCAGIENAYAIMFIASAFAVVGGVCCIRIFTPAYWSPWSWLAAGFVAVAIPVIVHLI